MIYLSVKPSFPISLAIDRGGKSRREIIYFRYIYLHNLPFLGSTSPLWILPSEYFSTDFKQYSMHVSVATVTSQQMQSKCSCSHG